MSDETRAVLDLACRLARDAGAIQRERFESVLDVRSKGVEVNLVTEVDHQCEELVVGGIAAARPDDAVLAEEGRGEDHGRGAWRWLVDPLDGTTNYANGYPRFCVSLGVERDGERHVGVVYDPLLDELYHAVRGGGAFRNGKPIEVSAERKLGRSLIATGFAYDRRDSEIDNVAFFTRFLRRAGGLRRDGSAALDLCYVACGRLGGYWELNLSPWDVSAGSLIVEEAGGRVTDLSGGGDFASGREIIASNGTIHAAMQKLLGEAR